MPWLSICRPANVHTSNIVQLACWHVCGLSSAGLHLCSSTLPQACMLRVQLRFLACCHSRPGIQGSDTDRADFHEQEQSKDSLKQLDVLAAAVRQSAPQGLFHDAVPPGGDKAMTSPPVSHEQLRQQLTVLAQVKPSKF